MDEVVPSFRQEKYRWLRSKLSIDALDIDTDIIELPVLIQDAGECVAMANEIRDEAKDEFERVKANIAHQLRELPMPSGKARSETTIESQVPVYKDYKDAQDKLSKARLDASLWTTVVDALRSKSMAIRVVADLLNSGFLTGDHLRNRRRKEIREAKVLSG